MIIAGESRPMLGTGDAVSRAAVVASSGLHGMLHGICYAVANLINVFTGVKSVRNISAGMRVHPMPPRSAVITKPVARIVTKGKRDTIKIRCVIVAGINPP
jgi:glycerol dehydrogenase-like iron-containing ADH family enzyme